MAELRHLDTWAGPTVGPDLPVVGLWLAEVDGQTILYASTGADGGVYALALDRGVSVLDQVSLGPALVAGTPGEIAVLDLPTGPALLVPGTLGGYVLAPDGGFGTPLTLPVAAGSIALASGAVGAETFLFAVAEGAGQIDAYRVADDNSTALATSIPLAPGAGPAADVELAVVSPGSQALLLSLTSWDNRLTAYRIAEDGGLQAVSSVSAEGGLSISVPTALATVEIDGRHFAVVAAAESSSLTVVAVRPDGSLAVTDHVIDTLDTRFQGITAVATVEMDGRVYIVAGGADDGLSLFTLLPDGRLLHLSQIADTAEMSLANVSTLAVSGANGRLEVHASSASEPGVTRLTADIGPVALPLYGTSADDILTGSEAGDLIEGRDGDDTINGGAGADILRDGAGVDSLRGGVGADYFLFVADGEIDRIEDFEPGIDRIDLSDWGPIHALEEVIIVTTATGAEILYGDERLIIETADGNPLTADQLSLGDLVSAWHALPGDAAPARTLLGGMGDDFLYGEAGDDWIEGREGNDQILGGDGDDWLFGGAGNDRLSGNGGADRLSGGDGADWMDGGAGTDVYFVDAADTLSDSGTDGRDTAQVTDPGGLGLALVDWSGIERVNGYLGADTLSAAGASDGITLYGHDGDDTLIGGDGADTLIGGHGDDRLEGGAGDDVLHGGTGNDVFLGGAGNDIFYIDSHGDVVLDGGPGIDRAILTDPGGLQVEVGDWLGVERIVGGSGDDTIDATGNTAGLVLSGGSGGADRLVGGDGNDTIYAGIGDDSLIGAGGDDALIGGDGNDRLEGGVGADFLAGGLGADEFVFLPGDGQDVIADFEDGIDLIDLSGRTDVAGVEDLTIAQVDGHAVLSFADGTDGITLIGFDAGLLDAGDFLFG
ncbi:MAG: hypothetical protein HUJ27_00955 [Rhodobacteraceae bacterium]|nr:hypothetical protein [Paracoccaceae bacterium]